MGSKWDPYWSVLRGYFKVICTLQAYPNVEMLMLLKVSCFFFTRYINFLLFFFFTMGPKLMAFFFKKIKIKTLLYFLFFFFLLMSAFLSQKLKRQCQKYLLKEKLSFECGLVGCMDKCTDNQGRFINKKVQIQIREI